MDDRAARLLNTAYPIALHNRDLYWAFCSLLRSREILFWIIYMVTQATAMFS